MVGLLLATKQKRGEAVIVTSNSFTSGYDIRLSLDFFWYVDNAGGLIMENTYV